MRMSIFTKLSLTFLLVLLPFYGMTLFLNLKGSQSIRSEITHSVNSRDAFYMQNLEQEINRLSQIFYELLLDKDPMLIGVSDNLSAPDLQDKVKVLQKRLQLVKASSIFVEKPMIYFPLMNRMITPSGVSDYNKLQNPDEADRLSRNVDPNRIVQLADGRLFLSLRYPMNADFERPPLFVVMLELSAAQLKNSLRNIVSPQQGDFLLIHTKENWTLSSAQDEPTLQNLKSLAADKRSGDAQAGASSVKLGNTTYWKSYVTSDPLHLSLFVFIPDEKVLGGLRSYEKWVWVILVVSVAAILLLALSLYRIIHNPLRKLVSAFRMVQQGRFIPIAENAARDEFHYLFAGFNRMVSQLNILIHEVYEKEISSQRSELKRLQAQINPHFLYNCFFIMGGLIKDKEYDKAYGFVHYLRDYYRFITKNAEDHIPLRDEMHHAQTYVDIQTICYGERIDVEIEPLPDRLGRLLVPRLIVQPIIENAYKYALVCHPAHGELWIHHKMDNGCLTILVEDNGTGIDDAQIATLSAQLATRAIPREEPTGILNVHRRLQLMFGPDSGLTLCRSQLGGLCVMIAISIKQQDDTEDAACTE
ncbi:sensor histidine kinase [Paenibacillus sp. MBLB4367]|uniref:sensor histidine kinase n=1 Tax=Paenibacillus sp. MBLB4367 TaxID=3384767 RepID=UPI00390802F5